MVECQGTVTTAQVYLVLSKNYLIIQEASGSSRKQKAEHALEALLDICERRVTCGSNTSFSKKRLNPYRLQEKSVRGKSNSCLPLFYTPMSNVVFSSYVLQAVRVTLNADMPQCFK